MYLDISKRILIKERFNQIQMTKYNNNRNISSERKASVLNLPISEVTGVAFRYVYVFYQALHLLKRLSYLNISQKKERNKVIKVPSLQPVKNIKSRVNRVYLQASLKLQS